MIEVSPLAEAFRPFWLGGLNDVSGHQRKELKGWINDENFQVYEAPTESSFILNVAEPLPVLQAYAAEISRISIASVESMASILATPPSKKSVAWLIIQTYYAAFFAAHTITRTLGTSCLPLEPIQLRSVTKISTLFGQRPTSPIGGGLYKVVFDPANGKVQCSQIKSMKAGPHEAFWKLFCERIDDVAAKLLELPALTAKTAQGASSKLSEISSNLRFNNSALASWLSSVRNRVNYDHIWATWYPYFQRQVYYDELVRHVDDWQLDPMEIDLVSHQGKDLRRFQATCNVIIALSQNFAEDMAKRCTVGKSFHEFGSLAFRRLLRQSI
ncbi:MAG TPA: hypothetical protein VHW09_29360 [Bryobacteraceae bacterium]|jgi:hypothetical protein|nr:hypothetical protein [Bryobacteraceae bacterium]